MTIILARVARTRWTPHHVPRSPASAALRFPRAQMKCFSCLCPKRCQEKGNPEHHTNSDPRINDLGRAIEDDFAILRENYGILPNPSSHINDHRLIHISSNAQKPNRPRPRPPRLRRAPSRRQTPPRRPLLARHHRRHARKRHRSYNLLRPRLCLNRRARPQARSRYSKQSQRQERKHYSAQYGRPRCSIHDLASTTRERRSTISHNGSESAPWERFCGFLA